ncbi:MAG TPA: DUF3617 family protein [Terracidiphilus sp.]|jgi:Protein of unknown function (DUF3617)|nr:DUF3617 family protein [Terracidiphilus sp.]
MRKTQLSLAIACCFFFAAQCAQAQMNRKPGLWQMVSTMTWQQSPMPPGMTMPPGASSPFGGGAHTSQVCVTQAEIDKYGAPVPKSQGECQVSNIHLNANSMSADWICTGRMAGKGTVESTWTDADHATTNVHFTGNMEMGPQSHPVEFTIQALSTYKGPDCGNVKPAPVANSDR